MLGNEDGESLDWFAGYLSETIVFTPQIHKSLVETKISRMSCSRERVGPLADKFV
jgi:hypothetical protein